MKHRHHYTFLFFVSCALIAISLFPTIRDIFFNNTRIDSVGHFISFFCLTLLLHSFIRLPLFNTMACLMLYAVFSEMGQYYLGYRNGELRDVIADILGVFLFVLFKWIYIIYWKKSSL